MGRKRSRPSRARGGNGARRGRSGGRLVEGTLRVLRPGHAFVDTQEGTFEVARRGLREGMNGDVVRVSLVGGGQPQAYVQSVMQRNVATFLGTYGVAEPLGVVVPLDERIRRDFFVLPQDDSAERLGVAEGDVVVARILTYPARREAGVVTLDRRVGSGSELDLDVEAVVASYDLPVAFPPAALEQAEAIRANVADALGRQPWRRDLRDLLCVTVDPADARDFDDAVSCRRLEDGGYELGVHIADVSHYVGWGTSVDLEARRRTCSVYLADRVIPMLPERLCNDVCSLRPGEDRLAMSVFVRLTSAGEVASHRECASAIRSKARLDYDSVDDLLEGRLDASGLDCDAGVRDEVADALALLDEVAWRRLAVRERRGSVDFETSESKVTLDEHGRPIGVRVRSRTRATSLVEEAMLLANECVAERLWRDGTPAAFRVHEPPMPDAFLATLPVLGELGLARGADADLVAAGDQFAIQAVLRRAHGTSAAALVNALLLRAQARATYMPDNRGHYALAARAYCHFTSPIRRYPDVIAHRALKLSLGHGDSPRVRAEQDRELAQLCRTCSDRERVADSAARASQRVKLAELYAGRVGEVVSGVVSGCERFGMFVTLDETLAEGLVPVRAMGEEWFSFDEARLSLRGESTGRVWRPGMRVAVRVTDACPARGRIGLALVGGAVGRVPNGVH